VEVPTPVNGHIAQKTPSEKIRNRFPIIGDDSVFPFRLVTLLAFTGAIVTGTIYVTTMSNKVDNMGLEIKGLREDFTELTKALGMQRYGRVRGD
jgi:hypothetical protein